ncbi:MAG: hypothetical protein HRU80_06160 [Ignavibacteriales bacterium]|nr:MAG: hypothetical protein HRU80_06160 [Ignavibacteriales bacterium]
MNSATFPGIRFKQSVWHLPALLGFIHLLNDLTAGMLIGTAASAATGKDLSMMVLVYNVLAFGSQPLAGLLSDKYQLSRVYVYAGILSAIGGLIVFTFSPWTAIILSGLGSSVFHVGGGSLSITADDHKSGYIGLFSSPGVLGLALGGYISWLGLFPTAELIVLFLLSAALTGVLKNGKIQEPPPKQSFIPDGHDIIMIAVLLAIAFRSAVWNIFQYITAGEIAILIPLALSAASGKLAGGFLADFAGKKIWLYTSLIAAIILLTFHEQSRISLYAGIFFLQASSPAAIRILASGLPGRAGLTASIAFGLAIAVGALPHYLRMTAFIAESAFLIPLFITVSLAAVIWGLHLVERQAGAQT